MFEPGAFITILLAILGTAVWFFGPREFEYKPRISILWYAILLHLVWGVTLFQSSAPLGITAISTVVKLGLTSAATAGVLYISVALLAFMSLFMPARTAAMFLIPQSVVLLTGAWGAVTAMVLGRFPDGVIRTPAFLITDQAPAVLIAFLHACVIWRLIEDGLPSTS